MGDLSVLRLRRRRGIVPGEVFHARTDVKVGGICCRPHRTFHCRSVFAAGGTAGKGLVIRAGTARLGSVRRRTAERPLLTAHADQSRERDPASSGVDVRYGRAWRLAVEAAYRRRSSLRNHPNAENLCARCCDKGIALEIRFGDYGRTTGPWPRVLERWKVVADSCWSLEFCVRAGYSDRKADTWFRRRRPC